MACGSGKGIRGNGHFRLEGKNYKVKDGDILDIRFSI
jgi:ribosome-binding ATPase YchF (GTP1/OBG family)